MLLSYSMIPGKDFVGLGVGALIIRDNKVLMLLLSAACRNNAGLWTIPGGMVETFEQLETAVSRETAEEVGLLVTTARFLTVSDRIFEGQHWVSILYYCETTGEPINAEPQKHLNIQWHDIDHLPENITGPSRDAISSYLREQRI